MWSSWRGYLDVVNHLIKCDANVNAFAKVWRGGVIVHVFHIVGTLPACNYR